VFDEPSSVTFTIVNALGLIGILVWHSQGSDRPTARLVVQILFFSAMTAALLSTGILPHRVTAGEFDGIPAYLGTSARILWWVHLAWAMIGFVGLYIVLDRRPQEARLIQDLSVGGVYLGVTLSIIGFVFGAPVGTLVATSGVVAIILCLALTRPDESHLVTLAIRIAADRQPSAIEAILKTALDDCRCIVQDPKPGVALKGMDRRRAAIPCHQPGKSNTGAQRNHRCRQSTLRCGGIALAMPALSYLVLPKANDDKMNTTAITTLSRAL
jgi:hypothetical protein